MKAAENVKIHGKDNNLIELINGEQTFSAVHGKLDAVLNASAYTGRAGSQVTDYIKEEVEPVLEKHKNLLGLKGNINV